MLREMKVSLASRAKAVFVQYVALFFFLILAQAIRPNVNIIGAWLESPLLQLLALVIFWLLSPLLVRLVSREKD